MDAYRATAAPRYSIATPSHRTTIRCLSASTASLNERVAKTLAAHEAAEADRAAAAALQAAQETASQSSRTFVTAIAPIAAHPHRTTVGAQAGARPTTKGHHAANPVTSSAPVRKPQPPTTTVPQSARPSTARATLGSSKSDYAIAKRLEDLLETYRTDPIERAALEHRLAFYKKQQLEAKLTRTPRAHVPPPPFEPSVHLTNAIAAVQKQQMATSPPPYGTDSPHRRGGSPTDGRINLDVTAVLAKSKELAALADGEDKEALALNAIQTEACEAWFETYLKTRPQVQRRPTQDEIAQHNKEREEAHRIAALHAMALQRMTRELSTSDARRAASARRTAELEEAHQAMERAMRWVVLSTCVQSMNRGFLRTLALTRLAHQAAAVVDVRQRYFDKWKQPVLNAIRARVNFRRRVLWRLGQSAALFVGILVSRRKAAGRIAHFLAGVKRLGRIRLSVSLYHRQLVVCQRAVRRYFAFRYSRLQLLHLQWDTAEEAMLHQRQMALNVLNMMADTKKTKTLNKTQQAAKRAKDDKKAELKAKATLLASNMTDEERIREIVQSDAKTHLESRKTPFTVRHKAILKYWGQLRRAYVRRAMESQKSSRVALTSASSDAFSPVASMRSSSFRRANSGASLLLRGNKASELGGERRVTMPLLMPKDRLMRMVQHTQEEYAGLCIQQCHAAARLIVVSKQDPAQYAEFRESLINILFPTSEDELRAFARRAKAYNENLFFTVKAVQDPTQYVHL